MSESDHLVDDFENMWADEALPDLAGFLNRSDVVDSAQISRLARVDQSMRWQRGIRCRAEEYLDRFPALRFDHESAVDLIYHEYLLRERDHVPSALEELTLRFPEHASSLRAQVDFHRALNVAGGIQLCAASRTNLVSAVEVGTKSIGAALKATDREIHQAKFGRYEVLTKVGVGSFGTVFKAHDPELDRIVAIKVPRDCNSSNHDEMERFLREARSVAQLRHPAIVAVHEIGHSKDVPFLVSEYVEGVTLAEVLSTGRPSQRVVAELLAALADALHYAHEMGVVHRDVKPANIMLDASGKPRLMDFGMARRTSVDATMTIDGQLIGTPAYMSPEQARGESRWVDRRSDIYSLGVILYQLLTGHLPFRGATQSLLTQLLNEEAKPPHTLNRSIPRDLETICLKAMAKEPQRRYTTARDLAEDLRRYLRSEPIRARRMSGVEKFWRWCRRQPAMAGLTTIVFLLTIAIALGGNAVVSILLAVIACGGALASLQYRRQAQNEKLLRREADENLYYHRISLAYRDLTASLPHPGRADELLNRCSPERRNWEWHYLKRFWRTEPTVLRAPTSAEFRGIAFSHDGSRLAAACGDGAIRVWDLRDGALTTLRGHDGYVYGVAFNPANCDQIVSSGNDGLIRVWDVKLSSEFLSPLPGLKVYAVGMACCVAFGPDGAILAAASEAGTVQVWEARTGKLIHRLEGHELWAGSVAFSPDGKLLASGSWGGVIRIWDLRSGTVIRKLRLPEHPWPVACLAFSPNADGKHLAAGYFARRLTVWDVENEVVHRELCGHSGFVTCIAFHPLDARRLISAGEDRAVRIWDVPSQREVLRLHAQTDICSGLAISPNGRLLASASYDRTIHLWDANPLVDNQREERLTLNLEHEVWSVAISRDGTQVAAGGEGRNVQVWDTVSGESLQAFVERFTHVFSLAFSPDGQRLAVAGFDDGLPACVIKVLDIQTGQDIFEHRESQEIFAVDFSPDGRWLAIGLGDGSVNLVDAECRSQVIHLGRHRRPIAYGGVRFRHDGQRLASASLDGTARIWDGAYLLGANQAEKRTADLALTDSFPGQFPIQDSGTALWSLSFSPDGRYLITGDKDGQLKRWDAESGELLDTKCEASRGAYLSVSYSASGDWIVSASEDCATRVYDGRTVEQVKRLRGHVGPIRCVAVNSEFIATGASDGTVKLWNLVLTTSG
ncbi:MAG: WD40 repeat domain-containing serine/threonine protein kinase [Pirellulales bacterium]